MNNLSEKEINIKYTAYLLSLTFMSLEDKIDCRPLSKEEFIKEYIQQE